MESESASGLSVVVKGLVVRRGSRRVLDGLSFELGADGLLLVTGPAGCGKSTLLQALAGVLSADAGSIRFGGRAATDALAAGQIGAVFQRDSLLPELTVLENLLLPLMVGRALSRRVAMIRAQVLLAQFGLVDIMHAWPGRLSDALRRRALLARVMAVQPRLLLLDDILAGLDAAGRALIARLLSPPTGRVASIVATTSRPDDFARDASAMLVLPEGSTTLYDENHVKRAGPSR
ncbi:MULTISPECIES: ABC transporter ATP-binding protein [Thiorhodovibrio]|uniref:ABC transporter ATP-binding protein n=1 Tax=Thiorhodovibrio TaxID=61593 RepID=UPI001912637A|nr:MULTISPECIES: ATP-binding cassette domain-containing protein [Thiorhodovibrio]WPL10763.1 Bicarbonate transport ATP-binding protein CmpD [Thiorhodovibrio litoralis]